MIQWGDRPNSYPTRGARSTDADRTDLGVLAKTLAEEIGALDTWLSAGGALPAAWERSRPQPAAAAR